MLLKTGHVAAISGQVAKVRFDRSTVCCQCGRGCGLPLLSIAGKIPRSSCIDVSLSRLATDPSLPVRHTVAIGDPVTIGLCGSRLVRMAGLAYLVPLLSLTAGAWLLPCLFHGNHDLWAAIGMLMGLGASGGALAAARLHRGRPDPFSVVKRSS